MIKRNFLVIISAALMLTLCCCGGNSNQVDLKLIPVKSGEKWGYINQKGEYLINPQFKDADFFRDGLAKVVSAEGKIGYISENGQYKIPAEFKDGTPFVDGLAFVVSDDGAPVCIDKSGTAKFELKEAKYVHNFSEGLALFQSTDKKWGFVDKSGKIVINAQFESAGYFKEGLAPIKQTDKWGFIDKSEKIVINPQFDDGNYFLSGKAAFKNGKQWGFVDKKGSYIINPQFDWATDFTEGMAAVQIGKQYGYINEKGNIEINPQFDNAASFSNGLAKIKQGDKYGYIDKKGKIEINPQFDLASSFVNDIAFVQSANKWGLIDKKGKYLVNPQFDNIQWWQWTVNFSVKSDYYDIDGFVNKFLERFTDTTIDGFGTSATLQNLVDNATYGNAKASDQYYTNYSKRQQITDEISISKTSFHFWQPIYTYSGRSKDYNFSRRLADIIYYFDFSGDARDKSAAIATALKTEIEKRYGVIMTGDKGQYGTSEDVSGNFRFAILYKEHSVTISIGFIAADVEKGDLLFCDD
jgi:hypothetical protein